MSTATIHPGVRVVTPNNTCTSNFVFHDAKDVYLGAAAHCVGHSSGQGPCDIASYPLGTRIEIDGASRPGRLVYSSWGTMTRDKRRRASCDRANDLALLRLDPADRKRVNPSVPFWGGPGRVTETVEPGDLVYAYGNSKQRRDVAVLSPQIGVSSGRTGVWEFRAATLSPSIFGDSGSLMLGPRGAALGIVGAIRYSSVPPNRFALLAPALAYMYEHTDLDRVRVARGTEPFTAIGAAAR